VAVAVAVEQAAEQEPERAAERAAELEPEQAAEGVAAERVAAETPRPQTRDTNSPEVTKAMRRRQALGKLFASGPCSAARRFGRSFAFAAN
jgi:hypothetical protein